MQYFYPPQQSPDAAYRPSRPAPNYPPAGYTVPHGAPAMSAPVAGSPDAYSTLHQQHLPAQPMVVIPQRAPQPPVQQQPYQHYTAPPMQYAPPVLPAPVQMPKPPPHHSHYYQPSASPATSTPRQPTVQAQLSRPNPTPPPPDYTQLLLSLAEDYIAAAHGMGSTVALSRRQTDEGKYHKLMSTGLACLETVLKSFRLHPRMEASLILTYATLLHEETDNTVEAEEILSKGITLCERHRMLDLKYTMQHLLARSLFKTSPLAALKSIDNVLHVAEMYQHVVWIYAFRFLRASLCMKAGSHGDLLAAQSNLRSISVLAEKQGDSAIYVASAAIEAMVHLRILNPDSGEQAQRAIASARSLQLQLSVEELGQIVTLLDLVDLACNLQYYKPDQAVVKMRDMQAILDSAVNGDHGRDDGTFAVLIQRTSGGQTTGLTGGIFQKSADGRDKLTISWMRRRDLWTLGYYLSGVTTLLKNPTEEKAENYLKEGLKLTRESLSVSDMTPVSVPGASERMEWHRSLDWHLRLHLAFMACNKADWESANVHLTSLENPISHFSDKRRTSMNRFMTYLKGVIEQGSGDSEAALHHFRVLYDHVPAERTAQIDLSTLAAMNSLLIIRATTHPQHSQAESLLKKIERQCHSHPNRSMVSAFNLLKATTHSKESSIIKMKQCIQLALHAARDVANNQLLCISMNFMTAMFFKNIVGEQAEKSARAGRTLAKRAGDSLWTCVADGMLAETYDKHGNAQGAEIARQEAEELLAHLPAPLRPVG